MPEEPVISQLNGGERRRVWQVRGGGFPCGRALCLHQRHEDRANGQSRQGTVTLNGCYIKELLSLSSQLKETSEYLRSNLLSEVAQQISLSTERTMGDFDSTKSSLEKLHNKLVQIEGEKDRERRLTKQREWVMIAVLWKEFAVLWKSQDWWFILF